MLGHLATLGRYWIMDSFSSLAVVTLRVFPVWADGNLEFCNSRIETIKRYTPTW